MSSLTTYLIAEKLVCKTQSELEDFLRIKQVRRLTAAQAMILFQLDATSTPTNRALRFYHGSNISYNLSRLEQYGLITRSKDFEDKRKVMVRPTERGMEVRQIIGEFFAKQDEGVQYAERRQAG